MSKKKKHPGVTGDESQESAVASYNLNLVPQIKWWNNNLTGVTFVAFVCVFRQQLTSFTIRLSQQLQHTRSGVESRVKGG